MAYESIGIEKEASTTTVTLNRPEKLNAMNTLMIEEITRLLAELRKDMSTRFVILTGAGKSFSSGVDMEPRSTAPPDAIQAMSREQRLVQIEAHDMIRRYLNLEQVTIAAVNGYCLGAGLVFATESDFIIAAESALLGIPEANVGVFYTWGSCARLSRLVGPMWAKRMVMTGENITAQQALQIGLVNQVVPDNRLMDATREFIARIASKSPLAVRLNKKLVNAYTAAGQGDLYLVEPELVERIHASGDPLEGARAFKEKRPPKFDGM